MRSRDRVRVREGERFLCLPQLNAVHVSSRLLFEKKNHLQLILVSFKAELPTVFWSGPSLQACSTFIDLGSWCCLHSNLGLYCLKMVQKVHQRYCQLGHQIVCSYNRLWRCNMTVTFFLISIPNLHNLVKMLKLNVVSKPVNDVTDLLTLFFVVVKLI